MIFYTQQQGRDLLGRVSFNETDIQIHCEQSLAIGFSAIGLTGESSEEDLNLFNSKIPLFSIERTSEIHVPGAAYFRLTIKAKRHKLDNGLFIDLSPTEATHYCLRQALRFLAALAITTNTVIIWRNVNVVPREVKTNGSDMPSAVGFQEIYKVFRAQVSLHAGHLYMAMNLFGYLHVRQWPERFYQLYDKGMMLLAAPELPELSFIEESYNCFFKCFEFLVMAKVLQRKGEYKGNLLPAAFSKLGIVPNDESDPASAVKITANFLGKKRGNVVAHYIMGQDDAKITPDDGMELKGMLDFMIRAFVAKKL